MRKKKILIAGAAAVLAASMIGGTWAAWSQVLVAKNEYETAKFSTFLTEHFEKPENWQPGIEEQKEVFVTNDSTIPVVAQVTLSQGWNRPEDLKITDYVQNEDGTVEENVREIIKAGPLENTFVADEDGEKQYAALWNFNGKAGEEVYVLKSGVAESDGLHFHYTNGEPLQTVDKPEDAKEHWLLKSEKPDAAGRYTFYFIGEIPAGGQSPMLLESVTMNPLLETTVEGSETYYEEAEDGYHTVTTTKLRTPYPTEDGEYHGGYDGCDYELTVSMKTTQATAGGMEYTYKEEWDEITDYISGYIKGLGYDGSNRLGDEAVGRKELWIVPQGRELAYVPIRDVDGEKKADHGKWFMSFTNMVPGETYTDTLTISNRASRSYTVYMRITPKKEGELDSDPDIEEIKRELLEKIYMEVYYLDDDTAERLAASQQEGAAETDEPLAMKGTLLYKGTSTGIAQNYTGAVQDRPDYDTLRYLIPLGRYYRGDEGTIFVRLTLDPNIGLTDEQVKRNEAGEVVEPDYRYADLLTKVDWEFLIQQVPSGGPGGNPGGGPGTSTVISDNPPPLASFDEPEVPLGTMIPDEDVPLAFLAPVTGDETPIIPIIVTAAALLALMAVFGVLAFGGKKKKEETA